MASIDMSYDDPNYTVIRQHLATGQVAATGVQSALAFRSKVAAVVTGVFAIVQSVATGTLILTLLVDGSVAAVLTLQNSINEGGQTFTLAANRTLAAMTGRIDISTPTHATGNVQVEYQYRLVPASTFSVNAAIS